MNEAATLNNYNDAGEMWRSKYEDDKLIETVDALWKEVEPLYNELHTYVLNELKLMYGSKIDKDAKLIPAHLLSNMWAQSWVRISLIIFFSMKLFNISKYFQG